MGSRDVLLWNSPSHTRSCSIFLYEVIKVSQVCTGLANLHLNKHRGPLKSQRILKCDHLRDLLDSSVSHAFPNRLGTLSASNRHFVISFLQECKVAAFSLPLPLFVVPENVRKV